MSAIRRQSIISSLIVYAGFALGIFNTWLFTREGSGFTEAQYGLTQTFIPIVTVFFNLASLGTTAYIAKFFPYYKRLSPHENDQLAWALGLPVLAYGVVVLIGIALKDLIINRMFANAPELIRYYYYLFPFGLGYLVFMILESWAWQQREPVMSNFLKEVGYRGFTTLLILFVLAGLLKSFDAFMVLYALGYLIIAAIFLFYFHKRGKLPLHFKVSAVTQKFFRKIKTLALFVWAGTFVANLASVADSLIITAVLPNGLAMAGIFAFGQVLTSLIQAPQRAIISAAVGPLSQAWKDKDLLTIQRIYQRSSINLLLFSVAAYTLILLNFTDAIKTFNLKPAFLQALPVFVFMGLTRVVDLSTGVNAQVIGTSNYWRFEFITGLVLLTLLLPLNYQLTRMYGIAGSGMANLFGYTVYNSIRGWFLWSRFKMQPFTGKSALAVAGTAALGVVVFYAFRNVSGLLWLVIRSLAFLIPFALFAWWAQLSPDIAPVVLSMKKRFGIRA